MKNPIIVLCGPTASGKTAMSLDLAKKYKGEIICADSMTVYSGMDIGTDKPTLMERSSKPETRNPNQIQNSKFKTRNSKVNVIIGGIRHHLLDILNPDQEFNAAIFKEKVAEIVREIQSRGKIPMLVGGSLLYIDSFIYDFKMPQVAPDPKLRAELEQKSNEELFTMLTKLDPDAEWTIDPKNKRRLVRALEVSIKSGRPFTAQKTHQKLPENVLYLAVEKDREELYAKINYRVDEMMKEGFLREVESLYKKYDHTSSMQATGYRQLAEYLDGKIDLPMAIEQTKKSHRNFAKRQLTWLRGNSDVVWIKNKAEAERIIRDFLAN